MPIAKLHYYEYLLTKRTKSPPYLALAYGMHCCPAREPQQGKRKVIPKSVRCVCVETDRSRKRGASHTTLNGKKSWVRDPKTTTKKIEQ